MLVCPTRFWKLLSATLEVSEPIVIMQRRFRPALAGRDDDRLLSAEHPSATALHPSGHKSEQHDGDEILERMSVQMKRALQVPLDDHSVAMKTVAMMGMRMKATDEARQMTGTNWLAVAERIGELRSEASFLLAMEAQQLTLWT